MDSTPLANSELFQELNAITNTPAQSALLKCFSLNSYICIDGCFISPFSLVSIKRGLGDKLLRWEFSKKGWKFLFHPNIEVFFRGVLTSMLRDGKILYIKIETSSVDFSDKTYYTLLLRYFKCLDTFYFMLTEVDTSFYILSNPLLGTKNWQL
ncbi:hypothetical protein NECID01_0826 [Nematocida sp. AWRm77]|nr:hypothetical protein NECID01_0826 [Nematocida sp. AWRm77]